ncbi:MAG: AAA family ATPase, partial [Ruminococcus sp.]
SNYSYKSLTSLSYAAFEESERVNQENRKLSEEDSVMVEEGTNGVRYWLYAAGQGCCKWDEFHKAGIMAIGWGEIGDLSLFTSKEQIKATMKKVYNQPDRSFKNDACATWEFAKEMKVGDIIFVKRGASQIVGRGVVESDYIYDDTQPDHYYNVRKVRWTHKGEWGHPWHRIVLKTLTEITIYTEYVKKLNALFETGDDTGLEEKEIVYPKYEAEDFLNDVYMSEEDYTTLVELISEKQNIVLQGAPGVGKTYAARRLAYSIMGVQDSERVMMVQFHQSYSYEDFIMGYRPTEDGGFILKEGPFYTFCKNAENDSENDYFLIIDEINRGNLSKIFGELFMLIEKDKRSKVKLQLLYSDEKFSVPENVYIIGMMNTADRSLAMLDYALRRRFAFYEMKPAFKTEGFIQYRSNLNNAKFDKLISEIEALNTAIASDDSLGEGFMIGHSYFCNFKNVDDKRLSNIVEYEIIPMLKEYWFDEPNKVKNWSDILRSAIK